MNDVVELMVVLVVGRWIVGVLKNGLACLTFYNELLFHLELGCDTGVIGS